MRLPRFTIRSLLVVVLTVAFVVGALRASNDAWHSGVFGLTLLILLTAVLLAVHRTERRRAHWLGFALFGWAYLVASLVPPMESRLPTTKGLAYLDSLIRPGPWVFTSIKVINTGGANRAQPSVNAIAFSPQGSTPATSSQGVVRLWDLTGKPLSGPGGTTGNFLHIGHSLLALMMGLLGGLLSRSLYADGQGRRGEIALSASALTPPTDGA